VKARQTEALWAKQNQHEDDRLRLFRAIGRIVEATSVLYPGSYVDIAPSMAFASVTYVDVDNRAQRFFGDAVGVLDIVVRHPGAPSDPEITFIHSDYTNALPLDVHSFDLLVSLYAGFVSEHCTGHLKIGGTLLVNSSHGGAAMASIDPRYQLSGVVESGPGGYSVNTTALDTYLGPKKPIEVTADLLHQTGRGIAYTTSPFAYLFTRVSEPSGLDL
jgi:hypothetical protein